VARKEVGFVILHPVPVEGEAGARDKESARGTYTFPVGPMTDQSRAVEETSDAETTSILFAKGIEKGPVAPVGPIGPVDP
jgi:hypothetical protein